MDHRDHRDFLRQSRVVVVVPIYKNEIDDDEKLSLAACRRCLSQYEIVFMAPERMRDRLPAYVDEGTVEFFPDHYFENIRTYSRLLTRDEFWERFVAYQYMLMYQLDAIVFDGKLERFLDRGSSYTGAPWLRRFGPDWTIAGVGNGGLSLRDVSAHRRVLRSHRVHHKKFFTYKGLRHGHVAALLWVFFILNLLGLKARYAGWLCRIAPLHEDVFWGMYAQNFDRDYSPATAEEALSFSFDTHPVECWKLSGEVLPFGCHAWKARGEEFWKNKIVDVMKTDIGPKRA